MSEKHTVYIKCGRSVQVPAKEVRMKDVAEVHCADKLILAKCSAAKLYHFKEGQHRCVLDGLDIVRAAETECPGAEVQLIGEPDVLVEWAVPEPENKILRLLKVAGICMIAFLGTAFSVMAYHNDVGIHNVFLRVYRMFMGREAEGLNVLEVSYSIGLALGITLFFNHLGGRRITADPTPIEVSMRNYEEDVDKALIEAAEREKRT